MPLAGAVLDRRFEGWQPDQAWVADIPYVATGEGWLYLAYVLDLAGRRIVAWLVSERIKADLAFTAPTVAFWQRKPAAGLVVHSDGASENAINRYRMVLTP